MKIKIFISVLIFCGLPVWIHAQDKASGQPQQIPLTTGRGMYVDTDNNGICDFYEKSGKK